MTEKTDETAPSVVNDEVRRSPGRPPKPKETPETVEVWVQVMKPITIDSHTNKKTKRGEKMQVPLSRARAWVKDGRARWTDPRPDIG